jgi:YD repeat-containing protein
LDIILAREFDFAGRVSKIVDENGNVTTLARDAFGRTLRVTRPDGRVERFTWGQFGQPLAQFTQVSVENGAGVLGTWSRKVFDGWGVVYRQLKRSDGPYPIVQERREYYTTNTPLINSTTWTHRVVSLTRPFLSGQAIPWVFETSYDSADRQATIVQFDGSKRTFLKGFKYAAAATQATDANGFVVTTHFDLGGFVTARVDPLTGTATQATSFEYDDAGRLVLVKLPNNEVARIRYDSWGRKRAESAPRMGRRFFEYDDSGNLIHSQGENGVIDERTYDEIDRLMAVKDSGGTTTYSYDRELPGTNSIGRLSAVESPKTTRSMEYDADGRISTEKLMIEGLADPMITSYKYNEFGQLEHRIFPDGRVLSYSYWPSGAVPEMSPSATVRRRSSELP